MRPSWIRPVLSFNRMLPILEYHETMMVMSAVHTIHGKYGDQDLIDAHRQAYLDVLSENGWGEAAFEKELLRRIDAGWNVSASPRGGGEPMAKPAAREGVRASALSVFGLA